MSGNVWEWCGDRYNATASIYPSGTTDPTGVTGPETNRVFRGGSWNNAAAACAVSYRDSNTPGNRGINLGFRLALAL